MSLLTDYIVKNEEYRQHVYKDTVGVPTIGIGFNLEEGFTLEECEAVLHIRLNRFIRELMDNVPVFDDLCAVRKIVLIDMVYNLGIARLLRFRKMLAAITAGDYTLAAKEMLDSQYARQVKGRAKRNAQMMETGEWYE